jgi:phosphoadenosine phosphosulfate reductase
LLQKAEKLALKYDAADGFYLAFSGGKDSQVLYHVAVLGGGKIQGSHELHIS